MKQSTLKARGWRPPRPPVQVTPLGPRPLEAKTPVVSPLREVASAKKAKAEPAYLVWVRTQACCAIGLGDPCDGEVVAHHPRHGAGMGTRAADNRAFPLCFRHHTGDGGIHRPAGPFKGRSRDDLRTWSDVMSRVTRARWAAFADRP